MPEITAPPDNGQQEPRVRNRALATLLNGAWNGENISRIRRDPAPAHSPDPQGPKEGTWVAEVLL